MHRGRLPFGIEPGDWVKPIIDGQIELWPTQVRGLDWRQSEMLTVRLMDGRRIAIGNVLWTRRP